MRLDYDKEAVCQAIYEAEVIVKGEKGPKTKKTFWFDKVILTSGKISMFYVDHRNLTAVPHCANVVLDAMQKVVRSYEDVDFIVSSESAGTYWGANVADRLGKGFASMRKKDEKGEIKWCGNIPIDKRIMGVDDLNTTYGTVLKLANFVKETTDAYPDRILVNVDRGEYIPENEAAFEKTGIEFLSLVTARDLIGYGLDKGLIEREALNMVESYKKDEDQCAIEIIEANPEWVRGHKRFKDALHFYRTNEKVLPVLERLVE
jgi:orotate phosphoribosyltransferase